MEPASLLVCGQTGLLLPLSALFASFPFFASLPISLSLSSAMGAECSTNAAAVAAPVYPSGFTDEWGTTMWQSLRKHGYLDGPVAVHVGGAVRLAAKVDVYPLMFNTSPLPDHSWLHGRMTPDEWRELITALNLAAVESVMRPADSEYERKLRISEDQQRYVERVAPQWIARGVRLAYRWLDAMPTLVAQPIPIPASIDAAAMDSPERAAMSQPPPDHPPLPGTVSAPCESQQVWSPMWAQ